MGLAGGEVHPPFRERLCYSLVADILGAVEIELLEIKSVRFMCEYPWPPGKRLRPITFLLSNLNVRLERFGEISANGRESRLAAAIEIMHEASLVHDDLVDRSEVRRGVPTVQMKNGEGLALLIGDYMVFRGLKLALDAAESRNDIVLAQQLATTGLNIAHGEADQLDRYLRRSGWQDRMSMENYLEVIAKKTAAFFAGCAEGGAALAGADPALRKVFRTFGMDMGIYFQMMDDLMDVIGDPGVAQKSLRSNLTEGTVTLPMIHAWELHPGDDSLKCVAQRRSLDGRRQTALYRRLASREVVARCEETMARYLASAKQGLARMPVNIYRTGLADLLDYVQHCPWGGLDPARGKETARNGRSKESGKRSGAPGGAQERNHRPVQGRRGGDRKGESG